jgi:hypothetical protein
MAGTVVVADMAATKEEEAVVAIDMEVEIAAIRL